MEDQEAYKDIAKLFGQLGGKANVKKKGTAHMSEIGKKGAKARWDKVNELKKQMQETSSE